MTENSQIDPSAFHYQFLGPQDLTEVKKLCQEWFPIEYPDQWYHDITCSPRFYSLSARHDNKISGLIVAELRTKSNCSVEDRDILNSVFPNTTQVAYILSLGVVKEFRRNGLASVLLDKLLAYLSSNEKFDCKAVYLHVLSTNSTAIDFYEHRKFVQHNFLPYYYSIKGVPHDGYCYVLYTNGGAPPWTLSDYLQPLSVMLSKLQPCCVARRVCQGLSNLVYRLLPGGVAVCCTHTTDHPSCNNSPTHLKQVTSSHAPPS